ncbi:MAG TPA: response regulator transcription factor [Kiritimatiellia bacterium]|nr:response regulator transcription factor [Kiritimatiellia bacterium]HMP00729.1 response regulator transcription factor [Kiritimatiellia bacterium]
MKICIIEDNKPLLENLRLLLAGEPGFEVTGAYDSAETALQAAPWDCAEVLLVDLDLPGLSGIEVIRRVHPKWPGVQILVYTISEDRDTVFTAIRAGAMGYLLKGCPPRDLVESLRILHQGGAPMSPKIARKVVAALQAPQDRSPESRLSPREQTVLTEIAMGRSYKEIAESTGMSPHTVHARVKSIYEKLHAASRSEALAKARELGLV